MQYETGDVKRKETLLHIANKVIERALDGDLQAIREIGDRLDGKPHQSTEGFEEVHWVVRLPEPCATTEEWEAKWVLPHLNDSTNK